MGDRIAEQPEDRTRVQAHHPGILFGEFSAVTLRFAPTRVSKKIPPLLVATRFFAESILSEVEGLRLTISSPA